MEKVNLLDPKMVGQLEEMPTRTDLAYAAIRDAIARGRIKPGDWMRQEALADELNVSQVTVREALHRLIAEGLALHVPNRGVKAVLLPVEELEDVYDLRTLLEGFALKLAATRMSEEDLAAMRALLPETVVGAEPDSVDRAWEANWEFHMIAIRASNRRHLERFLSQLMHLTNPYAPLSERSEQERLSIAIDELKAHTAIVEALEARDGDLAQALIAEHLQNALRTLKACLESTCP
jgi:DNA-binding GntR family transcriptional regulator